MYPGTNPSKNITTAPTIWPYRLIATVPSGAYAPSPGIPEPNTPRTTTPNRPIVPWTVTAPTASSIPKLYSQSAHGFKIMPATIEIMITCEPK